MTTERIGRYALVRPLGRGAMGVVWEALLEGPQGFRKPVAIKRLRAGRGAAHDREALLQEARLGALLNHPNVVGVHALEEHDGEWIVVMELVRGVSLSELVRMGPLPPRALLDLGSQAAQGLHHIHTLRVDGSTAGLTHRDIKPANLIVDRTGLVKVADLGVAGLAGQQALLGTPGYMAPEQWQGRASTASDLFALGVTLYASAVATLPFGNDQLSVGEVDQRLADPSLLEPVERAIPGLAAVLRGCLAARPVDRFASAAELVDALSVLRPAHAGEPGLRAVLARVRPDLDVELADPTASESRATSAATVILPRGNLVPERDPFIGRSEDVTEVVRQVRHGARLVTVLGPGGMGKTRLAVRCAATLQAELIGGAWFFDLSEARTELGACFAVGRALGLQLDQTDPVAQVGWALGGRGPALFVLDNLEQCVGVVGEAVGRWLEAAPQGRFLTTSRIRLGLRGESVHPLGPLPTDDAAALFLERAEVPIPDEDLADVRALVEAVDGLPLAVELAAARARMLPVSVLRERLGLRLLAGGGRDLPERHRSLQACLAWSWELLSGAGRAALCQLSVFEGGFDLAAAEAVLDLPPDAGWGLDVLSDLADASLVRVDPDSGRFSMFGVVQSFAREQLADGSDLEGRHGAWFAQLGSRATPADLDNLVAGCERALAVGDGETAAGCALGAWAILDLRGPVAPGLALIEAALACGGHDLAGPLTTARVEALISIGRGDEASQLADATLASTGGAPTWRARLMLRWARASFSQGRLEESRERLLQALDVARSAGDRGCEGEALASLAAVCVETGRLDEAGPLCDEALKAVRDSGDRRTEGRTLGYLGTLTHQLGDMAAAEGYFRWAIQLLREEGAPSAEALVLGNLGVMERQRGRLDRARAHLESALAAHRRAGNRPLEGMVHTNLGNIHQQEGELEQARERYEAGIAISQQVGDRRTEAVAQGNLGQVRHRLGDDEAAEAHLRRAIELIGEVGDVRILGHYTSQLARLRRAADPAEALQLVTRAEALVRQAGAPAMIAAVLGIKAEVLAAGGQRDAAVAALDEADGLAPVGQVEVLSLLAEIRAAV